MMMDLGTFYRSLTQDIPYSLFPSGDQFLFSFEFLILIILYSLFTFC